MCVDIIVSNRFLTMHTLSNDMYSKSNVHACVFLCPIMFQYFVNGFFSWFLRIQSNDTASKTICLISTTVQQFDVLFVIDLYYLKHWKIALKPFYLQIKINPVNDITVHQYIPFSVHYFLFCVL